MINKTEKWDVFISHASEDKISFVRPLAVTLQQLGVSVWYDEFSLDLGDSISRSIDKGLAESAYGIVVLSQAFIVKPWPEYELRGIVSRELGGGKFLLPIWHGVSRQDILCFSPTLADKLAIDTTRVSSQDAALQILQVVRPDLYSQTPRHQLKQMVERGQAVLELQYEIDRMRNDLENALDELSEFQCSICHAPLNERISAPADASGDHWDLREIYDCGRVSFGGHDESACPSDPNFPSLNEYEFNFHHNPAEPHFKWQCFMHPKTKNAHRLRLSMILGRTKDECEKKIIEEYEKLSRKYKS